MKYKCLMCTNWKVFVAFLGIVIAFLSSVMFVQCYFMSLIYLFGFKFRKKLMSCMIYNITTKYIDLR